METREILALLILLVFFAVPFILAAMAPEKVRALMADQTAPEEPAKPDPNHAPNKPQTAA